MVIKKMKPNNPLESVVFIQAEIKTDSDGEDCSIAPKKKSCCKLKPSTAAVYSIDEGLMNSVTSNEQLTKSGKQQLKEVENINFYDICDTDFTVDENGQCTCNKCGLKYINRVRLVYHMRRTHNVMTNFNYKCQYCGLEYGRLGGLKKHIKRKHDAKNTSVRLKRNDNYNCKYCGSVYRFKQSLYRHMKAKHLQTNPAEALQMCSFCPATFTQRHNLAYHIKKMHGVDELFCDQCGLNFTEKNALIQHIDFKHSENNIHSNTNVDSHDIVNNADNSSIKWYRNIFLSNGRKQCKFCDQILSNTNRMKYHIRTKHSDDYIKLKKEFEDIETLNKKFDCIICGQKYKNSVTLRFHVKLKHSNFKVNNEKTFTCEYCGLLFTAHTSLLRHLNKTHLSTESKEKKRKYEVVHVEVEKVDLARIDRQTDGGILSQELVKVKKTIVEKRYQCNLCNHTCKNIQSIKHHKIAKHTNTNEHEIKCLHCDYVTKFKQYLQKHVLVKHSNGIHSLKTFVCEICGFKTQFKYRLNRHLNVHREDEKFACEFCEHVTYSKRTSLNHRKMHTNKSNQMGSSDENCLIHI